MTIDNLLHHHAERRPGKAAVLMADRSITYAELNASVTCLARHLLDRGLRPGDRIAIHWSNSIETVQLLLAAFRAGLVAVPINLRLKAAEIAYMFEHSAARICFSEPALAAIAGEARRGGNPEIVSQFPEVGANPGPLPDVDPEQPAVILYTSGTTARPKGVTHTHRSLFETCAPQKSNISTQLRCNNVTPPKILPRTDFCGPQCARALKHSTWRAWRNKSEYAILRGK